MTMPSPESAAFGPAHRPTDPSAESAPSCSGAAPSFTAQSRDPDRRFRPLKQRMPGAGGALAAVLVAAAGAVALAQPAFMRNMYTGPVVLPQVDPRVPVEDTIAVDGERVRDRLESRDLPNPVPDTPAVLAEGEWLYDVYCAMCHGPEGLGDGQIAGHYPRMPSLAARHVQNNYTDGWIFSIIGDGGFRMPPFAHSMSADERWALVRYVKTFTPPDDVPGR